jgi:hypothetical protein
LIDKLTVEIWKRQKEDGFGSVILKGKRIAKMYIDLVPYRQYGNEDILVKGYTGEFVTMFRGLV